MSIRASIMFVVFLLAGLSAPATAGEVYVNGVKVTGALKGIALEGVDVTFDDKGDIRIKAPGYNIEVQGPETPTAPAVPVPAVPIPAVGAPGVPAVPAVPALNATGRYWLIVNGVTPGHYKVLITANGLPLIELPATNRQHVADITGKLQPGANTMEITFLPAPGAPTGPEADAVDVMVGEGSQAADGTLTIKKVLATAKQLTGKRSASATPLSFNTTP